MSLQAVVFDLDDTLYPERSYVLSGLWAVAVWVRREFGLSLNRTFVELKQPFEAGVRGDLFNRWLERRGLLSENHVTAMIQTYRRHEPKIFMSQQVCDLLGRLGHNFRLGLVTDGYLEVQRRKVAALGLEDFFHAIVYSDQFGREAWKPSTRPFEEVLNRLAVSGNQAVYIGDNPAKDFRGARQLGMGAVRIRRPSGLHCLFEPDSPGDAPDVEIRELSELTTVLNEFCTRDAA